jgi:hypothetical protein
MPQPSLSSEEPFTCSQSFGALKGELSLVCWDVGFTRTGQIIVMNELTDSER